MFILLIFLWCFKYFWLFLIFNLFYLLLNRHFRRYCYVDIVLNHWHIALLGWAYLYFYQGLFNQLRPWLDTLLTLIGLKHFLLCIFLESKKRRGSLMITFHQLPGLLPPLLPNQLIDRLDIILLLVDLVQYLRCLLLEPIEPLRLLLVLLFQLVYVVFVRFGRH